MTHGLQRQHLHLDCASGAAGDMTLGALFDLGVPREVVDAALAAIGIEPGRLGATKVVKRGIAATDVKVDTSGTLDGAHAHAHDAEHGHDTVGKVGTAGSIGHAGHAHGHDGHEHGDHGHQHTPGGAVVAAAPAHGGHAHDHHHYADIRRRIDEAANLQAGAKRRALDIFDRIARAEAKLHGTTIDLVAFHEVGAIDSIIDVVGTAAALDWLDPVSVTCVSVAMGHGTLHCAHGTLPVPAPAALEVLRDARGVMADGGLPRELCTPTGAAILASAVTHWAPCPPGAPLAVGYGAGDAELADRANVLRATIVALAAKLAAAAVYQIDANLDDMSGELCEPALDAVFAAGALDAWWTPIVMKKGRPALTLSALAPDDPAARDAVIAAILAHTTTIGVRYARLERHVVPRESITVSTRYGDIAVKVAGGNAKPEHAACVAAARAHGVPVKDVISSAIAAYVVRSNARGSSVDPRAR